MRFVWILLTSSALAFGAAPVRYRCADLLRRMEGASQRRASVVFTNAIAAALLTQDGPVAPDLLQRLVEQPQMRSYAPHLRRFEDAVLAGYLPENPDLRNDRDARRRYFAQAFDLPEPAVEALIFAYDLEPATLPPRETLREIFPIAPPRIALPRVPEERLDTLRRRSGHFRHGFLEAPSVAVSRWGDALWWRDVQAQVALIQALDGTQNAGNRNGSLDGWLRFHAGRIGGLWGSFVERRQLAFGAAASDTYPGTDVRVGGRRHADGWRYHWEESEGRRIFVIEGLVEAKASAMAAHHWFAQCRKNMRRLLEPGTVLSLSGHRLDATKVRLRTLHGDVSLEKFRLEEGVPLRKPGMDDAAFLAAYRRHFDAHFFRLHVPKGEAPLFTTDGVTIVESPNTRRDELRAFCRFVSHHLIDTEADTLFEVLGDQGRRLPGDMQLIFRGVPGVRPEVEEAALRETRARWIRRLVEAQLQLGRPLARTDFGDQKTFSGGDWSRLVGTGHFQVGGRDANDAIYPSTQLMLRDFADALDAEGLPGAFLEFSIRSEPYDPRYAAILQEEAVQRLLPFVRTNGRLPDTTECSSLPEPISWYRIIGQKDYGPGGDYYERRIFDSVEDLVIRLKAVAAEEGFRFRVYRSHFITENVSPSLMTMMREELVDDVLTFAGNEGRFPIGTDYNKSPLELDVLSASGRAQGLFATLEELALSAHRTAIARGKIAHLLTSRFKDPPTDEMRAALQLEAYLLLEPKLLAQGDKVLTTAGLREASIANYNRLTGTSPYDDRLHPYRIFDSMEAIRTFMAAEFERRHRRPLPSTRRAR